MGSVGLANCGCNDVSAILELRIGYGRRQGGWIIGLMATIHCSSCGVELQTGERITIANAPYCKACGEHRLQTMMVAESPQVRAVVEAHVCGYCGSRMDSEDTNTANGLPICPQCMAKAGSFPLPRWLKAGLAVSFALLIVALIHGGKFFSAGKSLYRGEKLIAAGQFEKAAVELRKSVASVPDCSKCILLLAKADLLAGELEEAFKIVENRTFKQDDLFRVVEGHFKRVASAGSLLQEAEKDGKAGRSHEALDKVKQARAAYPELRGGETLQTSIEIGLAYEAKDYDRFLELAQALQRKMPDVAHTAAQVASALACKFAVTGDENYRMQAHEYLLKAQGLVKTSEEREGYQEYAERIRHRLQSREIIDKAEFDRRFRGKAQEGN